jgi:hypothetical protein
MQKEESVQGKRPPLPWIGDGHPIIADFIRKIDGRAWHVA